MTTQFSCTVTEEGMRKMITGKGVALGFTKISEELAGKLTDDDIGAVLVCIDAKNKNLNTIGLSLCTKLIGHGYPSVDLKCPILQC